MSAVSVREFSYNPSAMFARVERGETVQVTRHGKVIAVLLPAAGALDRYSTLVAKGQIRLKASTTDDLESLPEYEMPAGTDPLGVLLSTRAEEDR
jgi:antitoxin (DNA-binding transcriptional repressor) of toxin-antitoxin stability system